MGHPQTRRSQTRRLRTAAGLGAMVGLLSVSVLMGCSPGQTTASSHLTSSGHSTAQPAATLGAPMATATWSVHCTPSQALLPKGWSWYRDARYPFQVAAPPTWRIGTFEYTPDGSNLGTASPSYSHVVDFFGPGSVGQASSSGKQRNDTSPPVITIEVGIGPEARIGGWAQDAAFQAQPAPVCINRTPVTLYRFMSPFVDARGGGLGALLPNGPHGYPYAFSVASPTDTVARDESLFLTMLATFGSVAGDA